MRSRYLYVLGLIAAAAGCRGPATTDTEPARVSPQQEYVWHCLGCHGTHGEGTWGPNIQGLNRTDPQIISVIANGQGKMPAFRGHLSAREMRELAEYVKTFKYKP